MFWSWRSSIGCRKGEIILSLGDIFAKVSEIYVLPIAGGPRLVDHNLAVSVAIKARDYDRLEDAVKLEGIVRQGIATLRLELDETLHQRVYAHYEDYVLHGDGEPLTLDLSGEETQRETVLVMLKAMEAMHNAWVQLHLEEFDNKASLLKMQRIMDDQFRRMFVPFPLLGWRIAKKYYEMTCALLACDSLPTELSVLAHYECVTRQFCEENGIYDATTLQRKLTEGSGFYPILKGAAEENLTRNQSVGRVANVILKDIVVKK